MKNSKRLNEMSSPDLEKELVELKSELFKLRFNGATGGADNKIKVREVKKNIARAKTILRQRELAGK
ncbi:MAG: 50S ribosomal protein L29 [Clostridia bacterium]|nr:50S ribosomal protein L29 [Clostridia bacterium]